MEIKQEVKLRERPKPDIACRFCGYTWKKRSKDPVECSRCKHRDFQAMM